MDQAFLDGSSEISRLIRGKDWSQTSLGPIPTWPQSLKTSLSIALASRLPMFIAWGPERIFFYNDAYSTILGEKHPRALGEKFKTVWQEIWKDIDPLVEEVDRGKSVYLEDMKFVMNRFNREEEAYFTFSYSPIRKENGEIGGLFCAAVETTKKVEDVTAQVLARKALETAKLAIENDREIIRASEAHFRNLVDNSPAIIWITDTEAKCTYLSRQWYETTGGTPEQDLGFGWIEHVHPEDRDEAGEMFFKAVDSRGRLSIKYRLRHKDGTYRWAVDSGLPRIGSDGKFLGYIGTVIDVHDQVSLEAERREIQMRFEKSASATNLGVWYCDLPFDELIWNSQTKEHFFFPPDARVTIDDFYARIIPDDREKTRAAIGTSIEKRSPYDILYRTHDPAKVGTMKSIRAIGWTEYDPQGNPVRFDGITIDVTMDRRRERDLHRAMEEAEKANKAKSAFLANMSHEIRTPMSAVLGFTELLRDPGLNEPMRQDALSRIEKSGRSLLKLIDDILDISKVEAGQVKIEPVRFSPLEVVSEVAALLRLQAEQKSVALKTRFLGTVPEIAYTDPSRLRQILTNLIGNAVKFTKSGEIGIEVGARSDDKTGRQFLVFTIYDTGIGMSKTDQEKIFQPFAQADDTISRQFGGTGLGLVLSKRLAEQLGGTITLANSEVGKGSCFVVTIEAGPFDLRTIHETQLHAENTQIKEANSEKTLLQSARVLVVDDVEDNQELMRIFLEGAGAKVDTAGNGEEAISKALSREYDVVLMDIQMPVVDGIQATKRLRAKGYSRPILALTAHAMQEEVQRSKEAGCDEHLTKPINRKVILAAIEKYMAVPSRSGLVH